MITAIRNMIIIKSLIVFTFIRTRIYFGRREYLKHFHPLHSPSFFLIQSRIRNMESYWYSQKNSDANLNDGTISDLPRIPCRKADCVVWRDSECIHIRKIIRRWSQRKSDEAQDYGLEHELLEP